MSPIEDTIAAIGPLDEMAMGSARARQDMLTKPRGSLGRLEELSVRLAGIIGDPLPDLRRKAVVTMAADHGVVAQGVSLYPQEVTAQMVYNFLAGGAGINVLGRLVGARVVVVDIGVKSRLELRDGLVSRKVACSTEDMTLGPAMSRQQAVEALETGIALADQEFQRGLDILGTGDMGIGNTTASAAVCSAMARADPAEVTGRGTGIGDEQLKLKVGVIRRALEMNRPDPGDALDVLSKVGGFEIGGIAGVILGAAAHRVPVVIDGFISGAGAMVAAGLAPRVRAYIIAAHRSAEPGHGAMLDYLGVQPLLDLGMRLGEGTGACLGMFLAEAAARLLREMATFEQAGVSAAEGS